MTSTQIFSLLDLPLELVFMIEDFLSPADTVCLALCNHRLMISLSPAVATASGRLSIQLGFLPRLSRLKPADTVYIAVRNPQVMMSRSLDLAFALESLQMRRDFLIRISRDVGKYYFCFSCYALHPWHIVTLPRPIISSPECSMDWLLPRNRLIFGSSYPCYTKLKFEFVHLQLAMRRFYYGTAFGIDTDKLRYTGISIWPLDWCMWSKSTPLLAADLSAAKLRKDFMTSLISVEARICPVVPEPSLCLRIQEIAQASRENIGRIFPLAAHAITTMHVCPHIHVESGKYKPALRAWGTVNFDPTNIITSLIVQYSSGVDPHPVHWQTCHECGITWKLEFRVSQDGKNVFLVSTRWLDLGPGLSPDDWQWKRLHGYYLRHEELEDHELLDARSRFEIESIQTGPSEEELFHRNSSFLEQQNYRKLMTRRGPSSWYLAGETPEKSKSSCGIM